MVLTVETQLTSVHCGMCGGTYAIDSRYHTQKTVHGGYWNCPYCQVRWGFDLDGTELARLKRKLEYAEARTERERETRERTERQLTATRGVVTRIKNRVGHGVCPCCNRTFQDLARHMKGKHPDYAKE
jgi:hypothetical protein